MLMVDMDMVAMDMVHMDMVDMDMVDIGMVDLGMVDMDMVDMIMPRAHGLVATEARVVHGFNCIPGFLRPNVGFPIHLREHESSEEINQTQPLTTYKAPSFACGCSACHRVQDILRRVQAHEQREYWWLETCRGSRWKRWRHSPTGCHYDAGHRCTAPQ